MNNDDVSTFFPHAQNNKFTDAKLMLTHIKNCSEIKEYILETSEEERRKVRTLHTMELDGSDGLHDDVDD